jgi:hypothetical protein
VASAVKLESVGSDGPQATSVVATSSIAVFVDIKVKLLFRLVGFYAGLFDLHSL